jgi:hypothetical protein
MSGEKGKLFETLSMEFLLVCVSDHPGSMHVVMDTESWMAMLID